MSCHTADSHRIFPLKLYKHTVFCKTSAMASKLIRLKITPNVYLRLTSTKNYMEKVVKINV